MPEVTTQVDPEDSIEKLSGKDLDKRVAHEVMGLVPCDAWKKVNFGSAGGPALMGTGCEHNGKCYPNIETSSMSRPIGGVPRYSEFIAAAMEVIRALRQRGFDVDLLMEADGWNHVEVFNPANEVIASVSLRGEGSLETAICRAALKVTENNS